MATSSFVVWSALFLSVTWFVRPKTHVSIMLEGHNKDNATIDLTSVAKRLQLILQGGAVTVLGEEVLGPRGIRETNATILF